MDRLRRPFDQLSFVLRLASLSLRKRRRLVIFVRFGALGDVIGSLPAVRTYMRRHPRGEFLYVTTGPFDQIVVRSGLSLPVLSVKRYVDLPWFAWPFIAKYLRLYYGDEKRVSNRVPGHFMDDFALSIGEEVDSRHIALSADKSSAGVLREKLGVASDTRLVLLHTGPTWKVREWPLEFWRDLAVRLRSLPNTVVLQIASDRNITLPNSLAQRIDGVPGIKCDNDVGQLIDTISSVDLLIAVDSGPVHVAAAVNTPCLALFGPTDPALRLWNLERSQAIVHLIDCSFCHHRRPRLHWQTGCPFNIRCMADLSLDAVFATADRFLRTGSFLDKVAVPPADNQE